MSTNTNVAELVKDIHNAIADLADVARALLSTTQQEDSQT